MALPGLLCGQIRLIPDGPPESTAGSCLFAATNLVLFRSQSPPGHANWFCIIVPASCPWDFHSLPSRFLVLLLAGLSSPSGGRFPRHNHILSAQWQSAEPIFAPAQ